MTLLTAPTIRVPDRGLATMERVAKRRAECAEFMARMALLHPKTRLQILVNMGRPK